MDPSPSRVWTPLELIQVSADYLAEHGVPSPRLDAELLLAHVLKLDRLRLYLEHERPISAQELTEYRRLIKGRSQRVPLQLLVGEVQILDLAFQVFPNVFIPRPETEVLIRKCLELVEPPSIIIEVGVGTGCVGVSLVHEWTESWLVGYEVSVPALKAAGINAERHGVADRVEFIPGDAFEQDWPACGLIVSNPPYVATNTVDDLQTEVIDHDPHEALFAGEDGLDFIRRLILRAADTLAPGGWLAFEHGADQGESALALLREGPWEEVQGFDDLAGLPRVAMARRAG